MIPQQGRSDGGMSVCIPPKSVQVEFYDKKKVKERIAVSGIPSHNYGTSLPYGITQCYLPPDTSERAPPSPQPVGRSGTRYWGINDVKTAIGHEY